MGKLLRAALVLFIAYLLQTVVMRFFTVFSVQPDLMAIAIVALCLDGDPYLGFCSGAFTGLLLDAMVGQVAIIYLLLYPLLGFAAARMAGQLWKQFDDFRFPFLIAPLITLTVLFLKEGMTLVYVYLSGVDIVLSLLFRSTVCVLYSALLALPLQFPVRAFLGWERKKQRLRRGRRSRLT